jgi:tetratricopeptide (TPR) repeat protein
MYYSLQGDSLQGIKYAENAFAAAERIQDVELLATIGFELIVAYQMAGEHLKVVDIAPRVLTLLEQTQRQHGYFGKYYNFNLYSAFLAFYGSSLGCLGNFDEGEALCQKGLSFALEQDNVYSLMVAEQQYHFLFLAKGDGRNIIEHIQSAVGYAEQGQNIFITKTASGMIGMGHYFLGELETALQYLERGLEIWREAGFTMLLSMVYRGLSMVHFDMGNTNDARGCIEESMKLAENNNEKQIEGIARAFLGRIMGKEDISQRDKAEVHILQGIDILEQLQLKPWVYQGYLYLGELYADTGQREKALKTLKKAEAAFKEMGMDYWLDKTQEVLKRVQG